MLSTLGPLCAMRPYLCLSALSMLGCAAAVRCMGTAQLASRIRSASGRGVTLSPPQPSSSKRMRVQAETAEAAEADQRARDEERAQREAALERGLAACVVRTKPLGFDRRHARYWWLPGAQTIHATPNQAAQLSPAPRAPSGASCFAPQAPKRIQAARRLGAPHALLLAAWCAPGLACMLGGLSVRAEGLLPVAALDAESHT